MLISGCVKKPVTPELTFGRYYFGYEVTGKGAKNIAQVFDDGGSTYLYLRSDQSKSLTIECRDEVGTKITTQDTGIGYKLKGVFPTFEIWAAPQVHHDLVFKRKTEVVTISRLSQEDFLPAN